MEAAKMATIGLYYPYIQFKDESWLKLTALYWDQMARIVPSGFPLADSDDVRMLVDKAGYVFERNPEESELAAVAEQFEALIKRHGDELTRRYSLINRQAWPNDPVTVATEPHGDSRLAYVYPTKMRGSLAAELINAGLANYGPSHPDVGLGMHPRLADVYMLALARTAAKNSGYQPVTDETRNHIAIAACTVEELVAALLGQVEVARRIAGPSRAEAVLLNMAFAAVIPEGLAGVPMAKIIEVRNSWQSERSRFQQGLGAIVKELGATVDVPDAEAFGRHLANEYDKKVGQPLEELKKQLRRNNVKTAVGAFSLATAIPTGTVLGMLLIGAAPWLVGAGAIGLGAYKLFSDHRDKTEGLMKSPVAYLVRLQQDLAPSRLEEWIGADLQGFNMGPPYA
jgi:hypothetical protein